MKEIALSRGMVAIVDDADFDWLSQWKWSALKVGRKNAEPKFYACRMTSTKNGAKSHMVLMHRQIMGVGDKRVVDHKNLNTLDYQRGNLRVTTQAGNCLNQHGHSDRAGSRFKGVSWHRRNKKWVAEFRGKYLGSFTSEEVAAAAYDRAATAHDPVMSLTNSDIGMVI